MAVKFLDRLMSLWTSAPYYDTAVEVSADIFTAWVAVPTAWEVV